MATSLPPVTAAFTVAVGVLSVLSLTADEAFRLFALTPGNTILGRMQLWNVLTGSLLERSVVKLGLQVALLVFVGSKAEQGGNAMLSRRLAAGSLVGTVGAGLSLTLFHYLAYMFGPAPWGGNDKMLFQTTIWGTGPLLGAFAVAAVQLLGDRPIVPGAGDMLTYALVPGAMVAVSAVAQEVFGASRDVAPTAVSIVLCWVYLRWVHTYGAGSIGDTRDEFEFLALLPGPLR